ncbi:MAG TPA: GNAT family N-acetyltransferase [Candidatus Sulfotelmatobacter sp.]|nr:GNAT family N-acetyltransferase [Candidatus Sulfotelmatobacter sp.]
MDIKFQTAEARHLTELLALMKELQQDDPWSCPFDEVEAALATERLLRDPALGRAWMIVADGQSIGYIVMAFDYSLEYRGRGAWVDEFFVRRQYRGSGIGTRALKFFVAQAKELGVSAVHLEVNHGNPAIDLYRRAGFEDHQRYLMTKWIIDKPGA